MYLTNSKVIASSDDNISNELNTTENKLKYNGRTYN